MTNKDLANIIFPDITKTVEDYINMYPKRDLKDGAAVTRFAPSPTGYVHIGNFQAALIDFIIARNTNGVFYLRNEDTDQERLIDGATQLIMKTLSEYNMTPDEYCINDEEVGKYGPYIQSKRKEIYHAFIKHLIQIGRAYPCFCTKEKLDEMRQVQEEGKKRIGYYGRYAVCRRLKIEDQIEKIKAGIPYVIRFKSLGNYEEKITFDDLVRGKISMPENDQDIVIMKSSNKLPTYHFAHVVDDYLMHTTHVVRGEEWLPSVPVHIEMFEAFGFEPPKYIHTPLILKKEADVVRKISKRKDPEASMTYYKEAGYPIESVIESLMTIINSNYEEWHTANPDKTYLEFMFNPKKMSATGGALYDMEKLNNISKNFISKLKAEDLFNRLDKWTKLFDQDFNRIINENKDYTISVLNIEREQKKPRKDYATYKDVKEQLWYMFDELFEKENKVYDFGKINDINESKKILDEYYKVYDEFDSKDEWFSKMKMVCENLGYTSDMKAYKANPDNYKGSIADISNVIRVALTTKSMTPDLYEIMRHLGKEKILYRFQKVK